ncbi:imm11 family protein [Paenibacillus sp. Soil750]|uniref:imm11 family protein n=1 Tax=Paenibacillus sp. Soil750 TaxID=1736398 RepID=UPI0006F50635|nr:DUF1629 domain-containing protein [Paenibacillus sp. Soil750]KRE56804.1 hypothetical protein ASL11_34180 [Paenibacillus sp. Soil750]
MRVWKLGYDSNNYEGFRIADGDWTELIEKFKGIPLLHEWEPIKLEVYEEAPRSDSPSFIGCAPVLSASAVHQLQPLINDFVEVLPTKFDREEYFIINVLSVLNCIDYDASKIVRYRSGRIMRFEKYEFISETVNRYHIFKIVDIPTQAVFVSDDFREAVQTSQLRGFTFEEVWVSK